MKEKLSLRSQDLAVFIGRFQPFHNGHLTVVKEALRQAKRVLILIGSANMPRTVRNPFTWEERCEMIMDSLPEYDAKRVVCRPLEDSAYNTEDWVSQVQTIVDDVAGDPEAKVALIGHSKDATSYYLNLFPQYSSINVPQTHVLCATSIRERFFDGKVEAQALLREEYELTGDLPCGTVTFLVNFMEGSDGYGVVYNEMKFARDYKKGWEAAPYPPIFVTVDAVVVQSGHILLIKRDAYPCKGLWALPGGFVEQNQTIEDALVAELRQETGLKVAEGVIRGRPSMVFDDPHRSARGRTITHAYLIRLKPGPLPKVTGAKDPDKATAKAEWVPLSKVDRKMLMEDHYAIIQKMLKLEDE